MTGPDPALLTLTDVRFGFDDRPDFLGPVTLTVRAGACWGIVGPNGAGKSTLLRLMAGLHRPSSGVIRLTDRPIDRLSPRDRARRLAFVPQQVRNDAELSAREIVLMGRFPHRALGLFESRSDFDIAGRAMRLTQTEGFAARPLATLSGGEAQRVHVAAALAQQTPLLLLDEPTASLDLRYQLAMFRLLRRRADTGEQAVVVVTHDVNLAARFCTHVLLLSDGRCVAQGTPEEVIQPAALERVYGVSMMALAADDDPTQRWVFPRVERDGATP